MWRRFLSLFLMILAWSVCSDIAAGQSGRRTPRPSSSPLPVNRDSTATPADSNDIVNPLITVLVGRQPTSRHLLSEDTIYAAFVQRLNEQRKVAAIPIGDLKKRQDAIKQARAENDRYLVLLQLDIDNFQDGTIVLNSPDLEIKYVVFAPRTGKEKYKGKVYYQSIGGAHGRKDAWPNGPPLKITPEAAAHAAADGLYDWLLLNAGIRER